MVLTLVTVRSCTVFGYTVLVTGNRMGGVKVGLLQFVCITTQTMQAMKPTRKQPQCEHNAASPAAILSAVLGTINTTDIQISIKGLT